MQKNIGSFAKDATFDVVCISDTITDGDFLATYRQQINSLQPDFCSILLFRFGDQETLYNQESKTNDTGIRLPCRHKHNNRQDFGDEIKLILGKKYEFILFIFIRLTFFYFKEKINKIFVFYCLCNILN